MLYSKKLYANNPVYARQAEQMHKAFNAIRTGERFQAYNQQLQGLIANEFAPNAGKRPGDLYQEWDTQTVTQMHLDEGEKILAPLMALSKPVGIGVTVLGMTRSSDLGTFQTSMSGEHTTIYDKVDYDDDKAIIPINTTGFKTNWRENATLARESFDDASIKQMEATRTHRKGLIDSYLDGYRNADGQLIVHDGVSWAGIRNDSRVDQVDLSGSGLNIDFTDTNLTPAQIYNGFKQLAQRRMEVNKITQDADYFVSTQILWNMQRPFDETQGSRGLSVLDMCKTIPGIGSIDYSSKLTGNQVYSIVHNSQFIQPLMGMGVSTIARSRPEWNSPFAYDVVSAVGFQVKNDFGGAHKSIQYAAG